MKNEMGGSKDREERRLITVLFIATFFFTCAITFLLVNLSSQFGSKKLPVEEVSKIEPGFCQVDVDAPGPYLGCGRPVQQFERLRQYVKASAGFDFLGKCGDLKRRQISKSASGVARDSKHNSGLAFDYNQEDPRVLLVREYMGDSTFWRTYLNCEKQDGTCGIKTDLDTDNAGHVSAYLFDFTDAAEKFGWGRIPAQKGWEYVWKKKEFWHYELKDDFAETTGDSVGPRTDRTQREKPSEGWLKSLKLFLKI